MSYVSPLHDVDARRGRHAGSAQGVLEKNFVDPTIASHRGRIVKTTGDGMLVEFASAVAAVRCAVEVQRRTAEQNAAPYRKIKGDRIPHRYSRRETSYFDDNDIFGDGVNIAARLERHCRAGRCQYVGCRIRSNSRQSAIFFCGSWRSNIKEHHTRSKCLRRCGQGK